MSYHNTKSLQTSQRAVKGSIKDVAEREGMAISEAILNAEAVILVDVSGSMNTRDVGDGRSRWQAAKEAAEYWQGQFAGEVILFSFADDVKLCLDGNLSSAGYSTQLAKALRELKQYDGMGLKFIVISDGAPSSKPMSLEVASHFIDKIDTVYIGPEHDNGARDFLDQLATGKALGRVDPKELQQKVMPLLAQNASFSG